MANTRRYAGPTSALLYVAARFMMVKIDYCAKRQAASYKRQAASNKLSS